MEDNNPIFWRATIQKMDGIKQNLAASLGQAINDEIQPEAQPSYVPNAALGHAKNPYVQQIDQALLIHPRPFVAPASEVNHGANPAGTQNTEEQQLQARLPQLEAEAKSIRERLINLHYSTPDTQPNLVPAPVGAGNQTTVIGSISDLSKFFSAETIFNPAARECGFPRSFDGMARAVKRLQDAIEDCTDIIDNDEKKEGRRQTRIGLNKKKDGADDFQAERVDVVGVVGTCSSQSTPPPHQTVRPKVHANSEFLPRFRTRDAQAECLVPRSHFSKSLKIVRYPSFEARWNRVIHYLQHCKAAVKILTALDRMDRVITWPDVEFKQRGRNNKGNAKKGDDLEKAKGKTNVVAGNDEANNGGGDEANDDEGADVNGNADDANHVNDNTVNNEVDTDNDSAMINGANSINRNIVLPTVEPVNHNRMANGTESVNVDGMVNHHNPVHGTTMVNEVGAVQAGIVVNQADPIIHHMLNDNATVNGTAPADGDMMTNDVTHSVAADNGEHVNYNPMANDVDPAELLAMLNDMEADAENDNVMVNQAAAVEGNLMANHAVAVDDYQMANNVDMGNDSIMIQGPGENPYEMLPPDWQHNTPEHPDAGFHQYWHMGCPAPGLHPGAANPYLGSQEEKEEEFVPFYPSTSGSYGRSVSNAWPA